MTIIDVVILCIIGAGAVAGFHDGFIKQLTSILGLVVGLLAAKAMYASLALKLCPSVTSSMTLAQVLAFLLIWIAVPVAFAVVASLLTKTLEIISLGWLNRWMGCGLGALKYILFISLAISAMEFIDSNNKLIGQTKKRTSLLYYPMRGVGNMFVPVARELTQHYILQNNGRTES